MTRRRKQQVFTIKSKVSGAKFVVKTVSDKRYKKFQHVRKIFRAKYVEGSASHEDSLLRNLGFQKMLHKLLRTLVTKVRKKLRKEKAKETIYTLSLSADDLDYPVNSDFCDLLHYDGVDDLLASLMRLLTSKQHIKANEKFHIDMGIHLASLARNRFKIGGNWSKKKLIDAPGERKTVMPLPQSEKFKDCCLLQAIVLGKEYAAQQKHRLEGDTITVKQASLSAAKSKKRYTDNWTRLRYLNSPGSRGDNALKALDDLCSKELHDSGIEPERFANCDPHDVVEALDKLQCQLILYAEHLGYREVFRYPASIDYSLPLVEILATSGKEGEDSVKHASLFLNRTLFFVKFLDLKTSACLHCNKFKYHQFQHAHNCPNSPLRCQSCRRVIVQFPHPTWKSKVCGGIRNREAYASDYVCKKCEKACVDSACQVNHNSFCKSNATKCPDCKGMYRKGEEEHLCNSTFCRNCHKRYVPSLEIEHRCQMHKPKPQRECDRIGFFDFETVNTESEGHKVNAVGFSWEVWQTPGVFSEVYFYDDDMEHPEDGDILHNVYSKQYWSDKYPFKYYKEGKANKACDTEIPKEGPSEGSQAESSDEGEDGDDDDDDDDDEDDCDGSGQDGEKETDDEEEIDSEFEVCDVQERGAKRALDREAGEPAPKRAKKNKTALEKFCAFLLDSGLFEGYTILAHNSSRFDSILTLKELLARGVRVGPMFDGNKAIMLTIYTHAIRVIDSYRYIKLPLSKFPERFTSLKEEEGLSSKGVFPYMMNDPKEYAYEGEVPDKSRFVDEFSSEKAAEAAEIFIDECKKNGHVWKFKDEIAKYLKLDVRLLRGGCLAYIKEFCSFQEELKLDCMLSDYELGLGNFHPFSRPYFTSSSVVHALWRFYEMREGDIYLVKNQRNARKTSKYEREWLAFEAEKGDAWIRTAFNHRDGQKRIGRYHVDGYRPFPTVKVYEFNGCFYHFHQMERASCVKNLHCFPDDPHPFSGTNQKAYQSWKTKKEYLENQLNLEVETKWECDYIEERKNNPELAAFIERYYADGRPEERLRLRTGLRGGRVESFALLYDAKKVAGRKLYYIDINSLYPTMAIEHSFPVGEPSVLVGNQAQNVTINSDGVFSGGERLEGLVQVTVDPPDSLYLPVLPTLSKSKLLFGLCSTCMNERRPPPCEHSGKDRYITDVYTTVELSFAVKHGYKVVRVWELFVYRKTKPIFRKFYTKLARIKLQSEGWPEAVVTEEEKDAYLDGVNNKMPGLNLKKEDVVRNGARRQFAKDLSNIGLGKFSQSDMKRNSVYVHNQRELSNVVYRNPNKVVTGMNPVTEDIMEVSYEPQDERIGFHPNTQVVIYAMLTGHARTRLLSDMYEMEKLGGRVMYCDTDSVVAHFPDDEATHASLQKRFNLNDCCYGSYKEEAKDIEAFVSLGCKNYALRTKDGRSMVKTRGFSLKNEEAKKILNYESMRDLLESLDREEKRVVETKAFRMKLDRKTQTVTNTVSTKKYRNDVFDKRHLLKGTLTMETLPFGCRYATMPGRPVD